MNDRHVGLLFDLDGVLISNTDEKSIRWNASVGDWQEYISALIEAGNKAKPQKIRFHIGICTFKPLFANEELKKQQIRGDAISATVLEDEKFPGIKVTKDSGLKNFIHPNLVFFTGHFNEEKKHVKGSKVTQGLDQAKEIIENEFNISVPESDMWIMDDDDVVWKDVAKANSGKSKENHYNVIEVRGLSKKATGEQVSTIHELFEPLFHKYGLNEFMPKKPLINENRYNMYASLKTRSEPETKEQILGFDADVEMEAKKVNLS